MNEMQIAIRIMEPGDKNFILSTWLRSYKHSSSFAKRITNSIYYFFHHNIVTNILERPDTKVTVACNPQDPNVIYAYLVQGGFEDQVVVHYIYVKAPFRGLGIAGRLAEEIPAKFVFSHWTFSCDRIVDKYPGACFVPYLL